MPPSVGGLCDTVAKVVVDEHDRYILERTLGCRDLCEHVDAVCVFVDHARDAAHLPLDATQSLQQGILVFAVTVHVLSFFPRLYP